MTKDNAEALFNTFLAQDYAVNRLLPAVFLYALPFVLKRALRNLLN